MFIIDFHVMRWGEGLPDLRLRPLWPNWTDTASGQVFISVPITVAAAVITCLLLPDPPKRFLLIYLMNRIFLHWSACCCSWLSHLSVLVMLNFLFIFFYSFDHLTCCVICHRRCWSLEPAKLIDQPRLRSLLLTCDWRRVLVSRCLSICLWHFIL